MEKHGDRIIELLTEVVTLLKGITNEQKLETTETKRGFREEKERLEWLEISLRTLISQGQEEKSSLQELKHMLLAGFKDLLDERLQSVEGRLDALESGRAEASIPSSAAVLSLASGE